MKQTIVDLSEIKLVGISNRTNNLNEMNPNTAKIALTIQKFFQEKLTDKILDKKSFGKMYSVYTNYQGDEHGDFTYFFGEEVLSFKDIAEGLETLTIPKQNYIKFTSESGVMPTVVIEMWQKIWGMKDFNDGMKRAYLADFEVYDERSYDPKNTILDIYLGVKNQK